MNVLFDLDGTLTDPRQGILACFKHALEKLQVAAPTDRELERFIGPPLWESFSTLCGSNDKGVVAQAVALYRERFATKGMFENRIYSGIADALASLQQARAQLFIVTSKARRFAEPVVEHFGLRRFFLSVHGSELDGSYADKSELIAKVLRSESLTPDETVMIGDRVHDVVGARTNGVFSIGALWGFGSRDELVSAGADLLCQAPICSSKLCGFSIGQGFAHELVLPIDGGQRNGNQIWFIQLRLPRATRPRRVDETAVETKVGRSDSTDRRGQ